MFERSVTHPGRTWKWLAAAMVVSLAVIAVAGCGSSKPSYCSDRTNLQNSVKGLTSLSLSSGVSGLESQLKKIQTDATTVVSSAKSDFPSQTSAIKSSVDALKERGQGDPGKSLGRADRDHRRRCRQRRELGPGLLGRQQLEVQLTRRRPVAASD